MVNPEEISVSIADGFEPKPVSRSSSCNPSADRSPSDLSHAAESLIDQLKNVGLDEAAIEQSETMMSVCESNGGVVSTWVENNQEREEEEWDGEGWSESEVVYPLRPDAEDCSFYMRTGNCKFGSTCKFNHPLPRHLQIVRVREKEEDVDKLRLMDCKYYLRTGGCKYGDTCRFNHTISKSCLPVTELNSLGLPIRPEEIECPYYMRTASCKYGADCKFNHPDPSTIDSPSFHDNNNGGSVGSFSPKSTFQPTWSSPRHHANDTTPFVPSVLSQSRGGVSSQTPEWNGYQASLYSSAETSIFSQYRMPAEEFPERPDQPECSYYLRTGDCKFKYSCKYHHPKNRLPKHPPYALNDMGLPLRPDESICTHYSLYGICKYGPACRFDHSIQGSGSSQALVVEEAPEVDANGNESDGWN